MATFHNKFSVKIKCNVLYISFVIKILFKVENYVYTMKIEILLKYIFDKFFICVEINEIILNYLFIHA